MGRDEEGNWILIENKQRPIARRQKKDNDV